MNNPTQVTVHAPATVANLVCGFDVMGLCLHAPYDEMHIKLLNEKKVLISNTDGYALPTDPALNTAGAPLLQMIKELGTDVGFDIIINKKIKPGSGIGSSAASAAGAVIGANHLLGNIFSKTELTRFAMYGEEIASGVQHADNIAPAIFGGVTLLRSTFPLDIVTIPSPPFFVTIVHPQIEVRTADARKILKKEVSLKRAIRQWGNVGGLVAGFFKNDLDLIGRSLEDVIIEPVRSMLIPAFDEVKKRSKQVGAIGGGISGSGPSIFMLSANEAIAYEVEVEMKNVYQKIGIEFHTYVTTINQQGVSIVEK